MGSGVIHLSQQLRQLPSAQGEPPTQGSHSRGQPRGGGGARGCPTEVEWVVAFSVQGEPREAKMGTAIQAPPAREEPFGVDVLYIGIDFCN